MFLTTVRGRKTHRMNLRLSISLDRAVRIPYNKGIIMNHRLTKDVFHRDTLIALCVFGVFVFLTLLFTYPVIRDARVNIAGVGSDTHYTLSKILNNAARLKNLGAKGLLMETVQNIRMDPITIHTFLYWVFGEPLGYNFFWLFSYVVSGFGAYLLVKEILVGRDHRKNSARAESSYLPWTVHAAAFVGGLVYAFHPAHVAWSFGFAGSTHTEWIPLATYALLRFLRNPRLRAFFAFVIFFLLLVQGENHFAAFYAVFLFPLLAFYLPRHKGVLRNRRFIFYAISAIVIGAGVAVFHYLPLIRIASSSDNWLNPGLEQATRYSNDLLSAVTPPFMHPLWGNFFAPIRQRFTGNRVDYSAYIGFTVLALLALTLARRRTKEILFWAGVAIVFYLFSMGPYLHVFGLVEPRIPLPYFLLQEYVPFFDNIRSVDRFAVLAFLGFAVVAGFAMNTFFERLKNAPAKRMLFAGVVFLIILEYLAIPIPTTSIEYSPFYDRMKNEAGEFSIIEIPSSTNYRSAARSAYYQAIHGKPMINTFHFARLNPSDPVLIRNQSVPLLKELLYDLPRDTDVVGHSAMDVSDSEQNTALLNYYGVRYIILHKEFTGYAGDEIRPRDFSGVLNFIEHFLRVQRVYEDDGLIAYRVIDDATLNTPILRKGDGQWEGFFLDEGQPFNRIRSSANLVIDNALQQNTTILAFSIRKSQPEERFVGIQYRGKEVARYRLSSTLTEFQTLLNVVSEGESAITLTVYDSEGNTDSTIQADLTRIHLIAPLR